MGALNKEMKFRFHDAFEYAQIKHRKLSKESLRVCAFNTETRRYMFTYNDDSYVNTAIVREGELDGNAYDVIAQENARW